MAAPPKFEVNRIPSVPHPGPPPIPVEQIVQKFAANEDVVKKVFDTYDFTQTVRVEELDDLGGKFTVSGEVYSRPSGGPLLAHHVAARFEHEGDARLPGGRARDYRFSGIRADDRRGR